jgi:carboxyl-terminal processing protease
MSNFKRAGMSRITFFFLSGLIAATTGLAASISTQLTIAERQQLQREARLVVDLLQNHHYSGRSFREMESKVMLTRFLEELDPRAEFLQAEDIEFLHRRFDRTLKPVYLFRGDLQPAFEIFDLFVGRAQERLAWVQQRLDRGFDFTGSATYAEREKHTPFKDREEADQHWERLLMEHILVEQLRGRTAAEARTEIKRRFARAERAITAYDSLAVRERFFDGIIRSFDPHSGYFSADSSREFALEMEKAVVGLGMDLRKEEGRCVVSAVQDGGPADLASDICPGDFIEAVREADADWTELAGLRLREIVGHLRGPAGTKLRVAYRRDGEQDRRETTLERARVILSLERAHGAVSELTDDAGTTRRVGWIKLPSFYTAGENASLTSSARDVRELLDQMVGKAQLDGLVLDFRDNPGGAVTEAVALSEIFLPEGVMMLSRGMDAKVKEHALKPGPPAYAGPLVVLISAHSASASEVFSGAMKYHRRALITGAPATYGKGTVQAYMELAKMQGGDTKDWGTLRLTRERFYLPDGGSVQRTGVTADLAFPIFEDAAEDKREADLPGALAEESVPAPAGLKPATLTGAVVTDALLAQLRGVAERNFLNLPEWELMRAAQKLRDEVKADKEHSLVLETRGKQWTERLAVLHAWDIRRRELIATSAYHTEPFEIDTVRATLSAQDNRLRSASINGGSLRHRLHQGSFVVETESGRLRKVRLETISFQRHLFDSNALATALTDTAGRPFAPTTIEEFLRQADLLEHPTEQSLLKIATTLAAPGSPRELLEQLLAHLAQLDDGMQRERAALDVPLREGLRLAAAWAGRLNSNPIPEKP